MLGHAKGQTEIRLITKFKKNSLTKWSIVVIALIISIIYAISGFVVWQLTHPARQPLNATPDAAGLEYENIEFSSRHDNLMLKGWLIKGPGNKQTIIFAHGYGKNRLQDNMPLLSLATTLVDKGINVVLFDFRNSGESAGKMTSVGLYEVNDLLGAFDFVQSRSDISHNVTVCGFSMGAVAAILAGAKEPRITAVIADSPFAKLIDYLSDHLSVWSKLPKIPFNHTILSVIPIITGLHPEEVNPLKAVDSLKGRPLLLIHGEADKDIPIANSLRLQQKYPYTQMLSVPGAGHVGSFGTNKEKYIRTVIDFLESDAATAQQNVPIGSGF